MRLTYRRHPKLQRVRFRQLLPCGSPGLDSSDCADLLPRGKAGVMSQFAAVVLETRMMIRSAGTLIYETRRTDKLRLGRLRPVITAACYCIKCAARGSWPPRYRWRRLRCRPQRQAKQELRLNACERQWLACCP